jgi:hypothetical protein
LIFPAHQEVEPDGEDGDQKQRGQELFHNPIILSFGDGVATGLRNGFRALYRTGFWLKLKGCLLTCKVLTLRAEISLRRLRR